MKKILYLSLTGMTEPLGRSQVLEYLIKLSQEHKFYLISFERESNFIKTNEIKKLTKKNDISWQHLNYSNKYGLISTIIQIIKVLYYGSLCIKKNNIDIIHARSLIPAAMGFFLKKLFGIKLLFDIRGFLIDEKIDSNRLNKNTILFNMLKRFEYHMYAEADHIVTLTHAAKNILNKNLLIYEYKVTVIPTCANKVFFPELNKKECNAIRQEIGFTTSNKILIHTGTTQNRYDFNIEVQIFKELHNSDPEFKFLIINKGEKKYIENIFRLNLIKPCDYYIISASFDEIYKYLNIADMSIFLIPPTYSKLAMAPTKFAENVACYLPSITNYGVGDMEFYMQKYDVGCLINLADLTHNLDKDVKKIQHYLSRTKKINKVTYDILFNNYFDISIATQRYKAIYKSI